MSGAVAGGLAGCSRHVQLRVQHVGNGPSTQVQTQAATAAPQALNTHVHGGHDSCGAHALTHAQRGGPVPLEGVSGDEAAVGVVAGSKACRGAE